MLSLPKATEFFEDNRSSFEKQEISFVFDCDGTLADITESFEDTKLEPGLNEDLDVLNAFSALPLTILSGRPHRFLKANFSSNFNLIGEYGGDDGSVSSANKFEHYKQILDRLLKDYPLSSIENKKFSTVWHYRKHMHEIKPSTIALLKEELQSLSRDDELVHSFKSVLEIKKGEYTKLNFLKTLRENHSRLKFIYAGDEESDEEIFSYYADDSALIGIAVDNPKSQARYFAPGPRELRNWIHELAIVLNQNLDNID